MQSVKVDPLKTLEKNIQTLVGPQDSIVYTFDVVPLDYNVEDFNTPKLFVTNYFLIFSYDDKIEIFNLPELEFNIFGDSPKFTVFQQLFEGNYVYTPANLESYKNLKSNEHLLRFSFNEKGNIPKEFVLRKGATVEKSFKTWAMCQMLVNHKNRMSQDPALADLLTGSFSRINEKTIQLFIVGFLVYFLLRMVIMALIPGFLVTILDVLLGALLIFMAVWIYLSMEKNLKRFHFTYLNYRSTEIKQSDPANQNSISNQNNLQ